MANFKKFMSGTLAALILVGMLANGISAKEFEDVGSDNRYSEQIGILSDIGIIKGTSENEFSPDEPVTREQMALLLFRLMIANDNAGPINSTSFTDLYDDTYSGAISWANASGFILGTSETTFEPTAGITLQDAMTMLVRALGHGSSQMNSGYPWTFIDQAVKLGLDNGLEDISYTKELTRGEVAGFLYNALTAEYLIPKTAANGLTFYESTTIIEKVFNYKIDDCVIVATNNYAIGDADTVTKTDYVTVRTEDAYLTVKFSELGLEGTADENLGENIRMVYKVDEKTKLVSVLGSTELGKFSNPEEIDVGKDDSYILIDGVKYQVVETLSDSLSTNANELLVYAYDEDGVLTQLKTNAELSALLGAFDAKLIFDERDSDIADRLIIKPYKFDQLEIKNGKVNVAGNLKEDELTIVNPDSAKSGSYILYYFNEDKKLLEIKSELVKTDSELVTRITDTTATIGGVRYKLGNEKLGITAASIKEELAVGEMVRVIVHNDCILAVDSTSASIFAASQYLIAETDTTPAFVNGKFTYVMDAIIDGEKRTIFVTNTSVEAGKVYRYVMESNGTYTLIEYTQSSQIIESGDDKFVQSNSQNDEIAYIIESTNASTIESEGSHYVLSKGSATAMSSTGRKEASLNFITDKNTLIIAKSEGEYTVFRGVYTSDFVIENSASVTAVFTNEAGSVETLRFLYISDGTLGTVGSSANSVRILGNVGSEYIDGNVYTIYSVLNLATGDVTTMMSLNSSLTVGENYLTNVDGTISSSQASVVGGVITGFTGTTITIGDTTYRLDDSVIINRLNDDDTVSEVSLSDAYMKLVDIITDNGKVTSIVVLRDPIFTAECSTTTVTVTTEDTIKGIANVELVKLVKVVEEGDDEEIDIGGYDAEDEDSSGYEITITCDEQLENGDYILTFTLDGVEFTVGFNVNE